MLRSYSGVVMRCLTLFYSWLLPYFSQSRRLRFLLLLAVCPLSGCSLLHIFDDTSEFKKDPDSRRN